MNQVSYLIYFANVSSNLGGFLVFIGIVAAVVGVIYFVRADRHMSALSHWSESHEQKSAIKLFVQQRRTSACFGFLSVFIWLLAAFMPSSNTVLAIAASQAGEQLLKTPTANLAEQALNSWLQKQITEVKAPEPAK